MEFAISLISKFHDVPECLREVVTLADEFAFLVEMLAEHDISWRWKGKTYEDFTAEADISEGWKVGIHECVNWAVKYLYQQKCVFVTLKDSL